MVRAHKRNLRETHKVLLLFLLAVLPLLLSLPSYPKKAPPVEASNKQQDVITRTRATETMLGTCFLAVTEVGVLETIYCDMTTRQSRYYYLHFTNEEMQR